MTDLSKSVLAADHSVLEFNKHAEEMRAKFANFDQIKAVIICNLIKSYGSEGYFGSGSNIMEIGESPDLQTSSE